ncbi:ribonuclease II/R family protein [Artemisia annua]|uniref:Ribonuclease II/R family protein n=1 Tax=Artemisia annua TaxID=35608 RepID=A0A2U1KDG6_ARTAN|nr:ribonuclease II/R family protein [Artemisia annua]
MILTCHFPFFIIDSHINIFRFAYGVLRGFLPEDKVESVQGLASTAESVLLDDKLRKQVLQKGLLLEFKQDAERILLAVAQKPDGLLAISITFAWVTSCWDLFVLSFNRIRKNGVTTSIKPQQIAYIVPGVDNFNAAEISDFSQRAQDNLIYLRNLLQDPSLLEFAWLELLEGNNAEPVESYCAHLMLSRDEVYFTVLDSKGSSSIYGPRSMAQLLSRTNNNKIGNRYLRKEEVGGYFHGRDDLTYGVDVNQIRWMGLHDFTGTVGAFPMKAVDTTGAGDSFVGSLLTKIVDDQSVCYRMKHSVFFLSQMMKLLIVV